MALRTLIMLSLLLILHAAVLTNTYPVEDEGKVQDSGWVGIDLSDADSEQEGPTDSESMEQELNPNFEEADLEELPADLPVDNEGIFDNVRVKLKGTQVCIYYKKQLLRCAKLSDLSSIVCGTKLGPLTIGCAKDEEKYLGLCYKKCSILTRGRHPLRTATNTCAKNGCGSNEDKNAGLCYPKCKKNYVPVGPVCWGRCDAYCGSNFKDHGLYCYRWWPPKACGRPKYTRGVGTPPHAPWTKGFGCNGFGVANDGGCARIDIARLLPYNFGCGK